MVKIEMVQLRAQIAATLIAPRLATVNALGEGKVIVAKQAVELADAILCEAILTQDKRWNKDASPRN